MSAWTPLDPSRPVAHLCEIAGLTHTAAAAKVGVPYPTLRGLIHTAGGAKVARLHKLAVELGLEFKIEARVPPTQNPHDVCGAYHDGDHAGCSAKKYDHPAAACDCNACAKGTAT